MSVTVLQFSLDLLRMSRRISGEFDRKCSHGAPSGIRSRMDCDRQLVPKQSGAPAIRAIQAITVYSEGLPLHSRELPQRMLYFRPKTTVMQDSLTAAIV
jgi:hypothetical protein